MHCPTEHLKFLQQDVKLSGNGVPNEYIVSGPYRFHNLIVQRPRAKNTLAGKLLTPTKKFIMIQILWAFHILCIVTTLSQKYSHLHIDSYVEKVALKAIATFVTEHTQ